MAEVWLRFTDYLLFHYKCIESTGFLVFLDKFRARLEGVSWGVRKVIWIAEKPQFTEDFHGSAAHLFIQIKSQLNWKSWPFVAILSSSIRSPSLMFRLCVLLNQFPLKAFFAIIWIISSNGTLVKRAVTSYDTRKLFLPIWDVGTLRKIEKYRRSYIHWSIKVSISHPATLPERSCSHLLQIG